MELTTQQQTTAFLWAFLLGAVIELLYTLFAAIRTVSPPTKIQLFISDFLFMMIAAILNVLYAISQTEGKIRLYVIAAEVISYIILYFTVSRFLIRGLSAAISFLLRITDVFFGKMQNKCIKIIGIFKRKCHKESNLEKI